MSRGSSQAHTRHREGGFDLIAPLYDVTARVVFGGQIMAAQRALLSRFCEARRALMIGGGTGELLALALRRAPQLRVCYVEASAEMIKRAQARLTPEERARVAWRHSTHLCLYERSLSELWGEREGEREGELGFDCVITCFMLDVLSPQEARELIAHLTRSLTTQGARWLLADFQPHQGWRGTFIKLMYALFRLFAGLHNQRLVDYRALLREEGWRDEPLKGLLNNRWEHKGVESFACRLIYAVSFRQADA